MNRRLRRPGIFSQLLLCVTLLLHPGGAQEQDERAREGRIMKLVALYLSQVHLTGTELDDEMSRRAFDGFVRRVDPLKLYFLESDIQEFNASRDDLDDMVIGGDSTFARKVWARYIKRLRVRTGWALSLLDGKPDFTLDENFVTDFDAARYAGDEKAARARWRRRIKFDLLRLKIDDVKDDEARERLRKRYKSLRRRTGQLDDEDVLALFLTAVTMSFDPHTTYMANRTLENFQIHMRLNYQGIGALLSDEDGYVVVSKVFPGGAAAKHGELKAGDRIVSVAQGEEGKLLDVVGMRLTDVVKRIRGKEGTTVRLGLAPAGGGKRTVITLVRARTELKDEKAIAKVLEVKTDDGVVKVGFIDLPSFYGNVGGGSGAFRSSSRDVSDILEKFSEQGVASVVLDLRANGGGLLDEGIRIAGLFIDRGPVVLVKGLRRKVHTHRDPQNGVAWEGPLVVLTSKFSASASEIVAGAVKDYRRGLIVGDESTHGKGTVQRVLELGRSLSRRQEPEKLGALKLTIEQFYRPGGLSTQRRGVRSDVVVPSFTNEVSEGEGKLPFAVPFDKIRPKRHADYHMTDDKMIDTLRQQSARRVATSKFFIDLQKSVAAYRMRKDQKSITLNEVRYRALRKQLASDDKEAKKNLPDEAEQQEIRRDEFVDEVLAIAVDYAKLIRGS